MNSAECHSTPEYSSVVILNQYFKKYPEDTDKVDSREYQGRNEPGDPEDARRDQNVDMRVTFETIQGEYIDTGKVAKIVGCDLELSLQVLLRSQQLVVLYDELHNGVAEACVQDNIPLVAYSPIGREFGSGQLKTYEDIPRDSLLSIYLRFQPGVGGAFDNNVKLVHQVETLNGRPGMPVVITTPGATTLEHLRDDAKEVELTDEEMAVIDGILASMF
ncbi:aldo/keto reductase [Xylaria intraflava]|nr:aldo/keto reductase [Xylaria intraflava]